MLPVRTSNPMKETVGFVAIGGIRAILRTWNRKSTLYACQHAWLLVHCKSVTRIACESLVWKDPPLSYMLNRTAYWSHLSKSGVPVTRPKWWHHFMDDGDQSSTSSRSCLQPNMTHTALLWLQIAVECCTIGSEIKLNSWAEKEIGPYRHNYLHVFFLL